MAEFILKFYDVGMRALRADPLEAEDYGDALSAARDRLRGSRFRRATVHSPSGSVTEVDSAGVASPLVMPLS